MEIKRKGGRWEKKRRMNIGGHGMGVGRKGREMIKKERNVVVGCEMRGRGGREVADIKRGKKRGIEN